MKTICLAVFVATLAMAHAGLLAPGLLAPSGVAVVRAGGLWGAPGLLGPAILPATPIEVAQKALELSVPAGSGLEGQWIPDINEHLYDDGAYKPLIYGL